MGVARRGAAAQKPSQGRGALLGRGKQQLMHWTAPCKAREGFYNTGITCVRSLSRRAKIQAQRLYWAVLIGTGLQN